MLGYWSFAVIFRVLRRWGLERWDWAATEPHLNPNSPSVNHHLSSIGCSGPSIIEITHLSLLGSHGVCVTCRRCDHPLPSPLLLPLLEESLPQDWSASDYLNRPMIAIYHYPPYMDWQGWSILHVSWFWNRNRCRWGPYQPQCPQLPFKMVPSVPPSPTLLTPPIPKTYSLTRSQAFRWVEAWPHNKGPLELGFVLKSISSSSIKKNWRGLQTYNLQIEVTFTFVSSESQSNSYLS